MGALDRALITTLADTPDLHPVEATENVYDPAARPEIMTDVPVPIVVISPGVLVSVHVPDAGKPLKTTLPVAAVQVGCVIIPGTGAERFAFTVKVQVAFASEQCFPRGLLVVTVIMTFFPKSPLLGVYVNENGDFVAEVGLTEPAPFSVIVTWVALPPKKLLDTVTAVVPHVLLLFMLSETVGGFTHCPGVSIEVNKNRPVKIDTLVISFINNIFLSYNIQEIYWFKSHE